MQMHVDRIINQSGASVDTDRIDNNLVALMTLLDVSVSNLTHGDQLVFNSLLSKWTNSSYEADTLQSKYNTTEGIHAVNWGGASRPMNVSFYGGKAWVELMYSKDTSSAAPWDNWINSSNNALQSYNITETGGLNYNSDSSSVLVAPQIMTNLLITAKTSILAGINSDVAVDCSHMSSVNRNEFFDYFTGVIAGFEQLDTFGLTGGIGDYDTHLGYRNGTVQNDEWMIADSETGGSIGSALWGYRKTGVHQGGNCRGVPISDTNIFSVFGTNY